MLNHQCRAKDLVCDLSEIVVIWKKETIHECPFLNVTYALLMLDEDFETNAVLVDRNDQLAFRVLNKITYCVFLVLYLKKLEKLKLD